MLQLTHPTAVQCSEIPTEEGTENTQDHLQQEPKIQLHVVTQNPQQWAKNTLLDAVLLPALQRWRFAQTHFKLHHRKAASFAENGQRRGTAQCPKARGLGDLGIVKSATIQDILQA